jgi:hypothetical protein
MKKEFLETHDWPEILEMAYQVRRSENSHLIRAEDQIIEILNLVWNRQYDQAHLLMEKAIERAVDGVFEIYMEAVA